MRETLHEMVNNLSSFWLKVLFVSCISFYLTTTLEWKSNYYYYYYYYYYYFLNLFSILNSVSCRAPSLKCLHIDDHYSNYESGEGLVEALMKLPLLEELQVYFSYTIYDRDENMLQSICQACPHLNKLLTLYFDTC